MADMRQYAGGGVEAQQHRESASQYQQAQYARVAAANTYQPFGEMAAQAEAAKAREEVLRLGAFPGVAHGVMQNVAYGSDGTLRAAMNKDRPLVDALCARLAGYCGEGGRNEGAVETLDRLLVEVRAARQGPTPPPERAVALGEMCSGMPPAPGKMFSRETFLTILRAKAAECRSPRRMGQTPDGLLVLAELIDIIENLE